MQYFEQMIKKYSLTSTTWCFKSKSSKIFTNSRAWQTFEKNIQKVTYEYKEAYLRMKNDRIVALEC